MTQEQSQSPKQMTSGKYHHLMALSNEHGIIAALAIDQRGSLQKALSAAGSHAVSATELGEFKSQVSEVLTPYASAILLDPEYGLEAATLRSSGCGLLLAYETTGFQPNVKGRLPSLLPQWSVLRLVEVGANAVKVLLYYDPDDSESVNVVKHAFIERIGAECRDYDVPFFLEIVTYSDSIGDEKGFAYAKAKPEKVKQATREFSKTRYGVDVLKLEIPVNMRFVQERGTLSGDQIAYTRDEAKQYFRDVAAEAGVPFIYLSAGVTNQVFLSSLELANEAGIAYAGVLCGRATWQDGIPVYLQGGATALRHWLEEEGKQNIERLNAVLGQGAQPWWNWYGGKDQIKVH